MFGSPIDTWDGATAYFTFADSPFVMGLALVATTAVVVYAIFSAMRHETESYAKTGRD